MKQLKFTLLGLVILSTWTSAYADQKCEVTNRSGTIDSWYCRNSEYKIRCYAEVKYTDGNTTTIKSGTDRNGHTSDTGVCYASYSDCWTFGTGRVNPYCQQ